MCSGLPGKNHWRNRGRFDRRISQARRLGAMSTNKWHQKAVEFTKLGKLNVALHCWSRALEEDPDDPEAWVSKGVTLEKLGKHQEAIDCYTEAININPCFATAWYNKGAVLGNFGNYREALGCF